MSQRGPFLIGWLIVLSLAIQGLYLAALDRPGLPLDDGWIHATYARNLARHGQLCLNPGEPSTGTTSLLWTALLAALWPVLHGPVLAPVLLGMLSQAGVVALCFLIVRDATGSRRAAFAAGAACALLGNLVWISLSGMEATLFLALALGAVWCRARRRLLAAGLLMGLLVLTRPEGLALPLTMALFELPTLWRALRTRQRPRAEMAAWLLLFGPVAVAAATYAAVNLATTGHVLTSTFAGRRWLAGQPEHVALGPIAVAERLGQFVSAWWVYLDRWVFGTILLAWLGLPAAALLGGILAALTALLALLGLLSLHWRHPEPSGGPCPLVLLLAWALAHNAIYVLLLPVHGHAGRYQAVNFVVLAVLVVLGVRRLLPPLPRGEGRGEGASLRARGRRRVRKLAVGATALAASLCLGSTALWRTVYRDSVSHIVSVHIACGQFIARELPPDAVVATYDLGAISFFAQRRVVDLGGLVDPAMARCLFAGDAVPYLREKGVTHLALVQREEGDGFLAEKLGLLTAPGAAPRVRLLPLPGDGVPRWQIPLERYRLHHAATSNAMPILILCRLEWPGN